MIPPIANSILVSNPQFASLHRHLTTNLLDPDTSTRALSEAHTSTSQALRSHLLQAAKEELLKSSIRNIATKSVEKEDGEVLYLAPKQREIVGTISMILDEAPTLDLNEDDYELLRPDIDAFHDNVKEIAIPISRDLRHQYDILCKIASPASLPVEPASTKQMANSKRTLNKTVKSTTVSSSTPSLPALLYPLLPQIPVPTLHSSLASLYNTTLQHSATHLTLLRTVLTHLELTMHGLHARNTKARSAHLSTVASALSKKIEMVYLRCRNSLYNKDVQTALGNYQRHLEKMEREVGEREWCLRGVVDEFESVGSGLDLENGGEGEDKGKGKGKKGVMREVGRRYGEVLREIERVREEVERLEGGDGAVQQSRAAKKSGSERVGES